MPSMAKKRKKRRPSAWTAKQVRALRERLDLTQEEAAAKVGVTRRQWAAWEGGESTPSGPAAKLLDLMGDGKI